jgi:prepilin-type N-terminal cleavage/methylation domain-containing protein
MNYRYNILGALTHKKQGFTLIELMIAVAILALLGMIAFPIYRQSAEKAQKSAAMAVMDPMPVLVEAYRADNGMMCPAIHCTVDGTYTYSYTENLTTGVENTVGNKITDIYPNFKAKGVTQTGPSKYHYQIVFTVVGGVQTAVVTAIPQTSLGAPPGNIVSAPFN